MQYKPLMLPSNLKVGTKRNLKRLSEKDLTALLKQVVKLQGYRLVFKKLKNCGGYFSESEKLIVVSTAVSKYNLPFTIFHELGHAYCYKNHIWPSYHKMRRFHVLKYTALKAEKWCDDYAEHHTNLFFTNAIIWKSYHLPSGAVFLKNYYNNYNTKVNKTNAN